MNGALLINKPQGISSFGVIELFQRQWMDAQGPKAKRRDMPKFGHGGTLDPFATGLLIVLCGRAVKLARYFLGATKGYEGVMRFGETTVPGDPTSPVSEKSDVLPLSLEQLQELAHKLTLQPYQQTPPMHSAKKVKGRPLYELAREGIEIEREPKTCHLYQFEVNSYEPPTAHFQLKCSSGTYIRTLSQDLAKLLGSVGMLDSLHRTSSGVFSVKNAWTPEQILQANQEGKKWDELPCWVSFDRLLGGYPRADVTASECEALQQGRQNVLFNILKKASSPEDKSAEKQDCIAIYHEETLIAVARKDENIWGIERVFQRENEPQAVFRGE
jgi:tRNA pseudouridine55 synthase